ncbi:MAG TPA: tetratricopeptide repeat protein [Rhodocyclaceae bacterium]|nr:tetratricopeptide repeat protein [Rhodocyclaceae bacterium]
MIAKAILTVLLLASAGFASLSAAAADPTMHQVYEAAQAGRMAEAQGMMDQVLRDHPNSAKAHFVEAELLAQQGRVAGAAAELATAERLAPGLPFAKPQAVQNLKTRIAGPQRLAPAGVRPAAAPGIPWGLLIAGLALIAAIVFFARSMGRRNAGYIPAANGAYPGGPVQAYGPGGVAPMGPIGPAGGGIGSGIMGGLATGAALGAGMVAGEALMHHFTDGNRPGVAPSVADSWDAPPNDMGGADFGVSDSGSWDDGSGGGGGDDWS